MVPACRRSSPADRRATRCRSRIRRSCLRSRTCRDPPSRRSSPTLRRGSHRVGAVIRRRTDAAHGRSTSRPTESSSCAQRYSVTVLGTIDERPEDEARRVARAGDGEIDRTATTRVGRQRVGHRRRGRRGDLEGAIVARRADAGHDSLRSDPGRRAAGTVSVAVPSDQDSPVTGSDVGFGRLLLSWKSRL